MEIQLRNTGKKYINEWVFRNVTLDLHAGDTLAILGKNGSGKTTLMKLLSGAVMPTEGEMNFFRDGQPLPLENLYHELSYAAPYHEMIEELTVKEMAEFYTHFKPLKQNCSIEDILSSINLSAAADKKVLSCSSGMKQKLKLALALNSDTSLLLLDEPLTNLDREGIAWFQTEMSRQPGNRIIVVCSNHITEEYEFCRRQVKMEDYRNNLP